MRKQSVILATVLVLIVLTAGIFWWSHHPSVADAPQSSNQIEPPNPGAASVPVASPTGDQTTASALATPAARSATVVNSTPGSPRAGTTAVAPILGANSLPPSTTPADAASSNQAGMRELDKVRHMIGDYHTLMGENPVGTNAEIMKALMGGNPHQATLGPAEGQSLNDKGELVDPWGTPYFFHQLSGDHMEIHSAGPDKIMGTADDLVVK